MIVESVGKVEIELGLNENEGRAEIMFHLRMDHDGDGLTELTGPYYSVLGMTKAFPNYRQEILTASRAFLSRNLPADHRRRLERAIALA